MWWNSSNGQKAKQVNNKDDRLHGLYTEWNENGQKAFEVNYINGEKDGVETKWWPDGTKQIETTYKNGSATTYDANRDISQQSQQKDVESNGVFSEEDAYWQQVEITGKALKSKHSNQLCSILGTQLLQLRSLLLRYPEQLRFAAYASNHSEVEKLLVEADNSNCAY
jgi:hypothetical protein